LIINSLWKMKLWVSIILSLFHGSAFRITGSAYECSQAKASADRLFEAE